MRFMKIFFMIHNDLKSYIESVGKIEGVLTVHTFINGCRIHNENACSLASHKFMDHIRLQ